MGKHFTLKFSIAWHLQIRLDTLISSKESLKSLISKTKRASGATSKEIKSCHITYCWGKKTTILGKEKAVFNSKKYVCYEWPWPKNYDIFFADAY